MKRNLKRTRIFSSTKSTSSSNRTRVKPFESEFLFGRSAASSLPNTSEEPLQRNKCSGSGGKDRITVVKGIQFGKLVIDSLMIQEKMLPPAPSLPTSEKSDDRRPVISGIQFNKMVFSDIKCQAPEKYRAEDSSTSASSCTNYSLEKVPLLSKDRPFSAFIQFKKIAGKSIAGCVDFNKLLKDLRRSASDQQFVSLQRNKCSICGFASTFREEE